MTDRERMLERVRPCIGWEGFANVEAFVEMALAIKRETEQHVAGECADIAEEHTEHGEFSCGGSRHPECPQYIADAIRAKYPKEKTCTTD